MTEGKARRKIRRGRKASRVRLRTAHRSTLFRYAESVIRGTYILRFVFLLFALWFVFATAFFVAERRAPDPVVTTFGEALYWCVAAFSTAGIANTPSAGLSQLIGGTWIIIGSAVFFGIIVATITGFFMRPMQRPAHKIVETIEYNLEHLQDLSVEELDLLRATTDSLIDHMEQLKEKSETVE